MHVAPCSQEMTVTEPNGGGVSPDAEALALRIMELPEGKREEALASLAGGDADLEARTRDILSSFARADAFFKRLTPLRDAILSDRETKEFGAVDPAEGPHEDPQPERIGPWKVLSLLGRGGMGAVYLAEREGPDYEHRVAVKVLHAGLVRGPFRERFLAERRILATLTHPGIAQFIEGGWLPDGRPWLAMEFVEGEDIIAWADARKLGLRARVELFVQVCRAVEYAHRRLVVHRDLKPSNTRVTPEGTVKLLDFGIAKVIQAEGDAGTSPEITAVYPLSSQALTPAYASPEQLRGDPVGVASDIYSMGMLLWRLLAGENPRRETGVDPKRGTDSSRVTPLQVLRTEGRLQAEAERRGLSPERFRRELRGDLTAILQTCLRPEPDARYGSVAELEMELRRYLEGRPVAARSGSRAYRMRRFVARNAWALVAGVVAALALSGGVAGIWIHSLRLEEERDRATLEAERARAATGFVVDLFEGAGEGTALDTVRAGTLLERGEERLRERTTAHPLLRAELLLALANANAGLRRVGEDMRLREERLTVLEEHMGPHSMEFARELADHGRYRGVAFQWASSRDALTRALEAVDSASARGEPADPRLRAMILGDLALSLRRTGETDAAVDAAFEALALRQLDRESEGDPALLSAMADLASTLRGADRLEEAEALLRELVAVSAQRPAEIPLGERVRFRNDLGAILRLQGEYEEAESYYQEAMALLRETGDTDSDNMETLVNNVHYLLGVSGRLEEAEAFADSFRVELLQSHPPDHWRVGRGHLRIGWGWLRSESCQRGLHALEEGAAIYSQALGAEHLWTAAAHADVARCLFRVGREEEGAEVLQWVLPLLAPVETPAGRRRTRELVDLLASHLEASGEEVRAEQVRRRWGDGTGS